MRHHGDARAEVKTYPERPAAPKQKAAVTEGCGLSSASPDAVRRIHEALRPSDLPDSAAPFGNTWQSTHAFADPTIRMIINTSAM